MTSKEKKEYIKWVNSFANQKTVATKTTKTKKKGKHATNQK